MSKTQPNHISRTITMITVVIFGIIAVAINTDISQHAYAQTSVTSDQVLDQIKQLDSDLNSQFQLLNPTPLDFDTYSGIVWQTQDSSFTFSVDALKGDQGQRQAQFAEFMNTTTTAEQPTTISGHPGWIEAYNDYYDVWVNVRWGDGNYFSPLAEFSFKIPSSITGNNDQVKAFKDQKQKDVIDIVNKIDGILTQHGFYNFEGQSAPPQAPTQHLPIIFIPGVAGSYLFSGYTPTWILAGPNAKYMFLKTDGITPANTTVPITATSILANHGSGSSENPANFYGGFEDYLVANQNYTLGNDLVEFPYDWRLDNAKHLPELDQLVNSVLNKTHASKVILIAHSMGGLIAKAYVNGLGSSKVDTLITIGTPFYGAVKPYYALVNGYDFNNPAATRLSMKILAQNAPGVYQLLPRLPFVHDLDSSRDLTLDESNQIKYKGVMTGTFSYYETPDNLWSFNQGLITNANNFYSNILNQDNTPKPLPSGVRHYVIIGTGVETLNGYDIIDAPQDKQFIELLNRHVWLVPNFGDGDGTVPIWSSPISGVTQTYYIQYKPGASSEHGKLTDNPDVQKIVGSILSGSPVDSSSYSDQGQTRTDRTSFSLHSNAHLTILDEQSGKNLGFNNQGEVDEGIDTGTFLAMDGGEYASIRDASDTYKVLVNGTGNGKFTLIANVTKSGQSAVFSYPDVPVQQGTIAQMEIAPSQVSSSSMPTLQVSTGGQTTSVSATSGTGLILSSTPSQTPSTTLQIPAWIKNNAGWWAQGQISDGDFVKGIQFLINNGIMVIPQTQTSSQQSQQIPSWVKNNAGWWAQGQIGDGDFVKGIQFLISNGIMAVGQASSSTQVQSSVTQSPITASNQNPLMQQATSHLPPPPKSQSANGYFQIDKSQYMAMANPNEMATISGKVDSANGGVVVFTITKPDGTTEPINADVTNAGDFRTLIIIDASFPKGTYTISATYQNSDLGLITFTVN